jgi:selT/selW/selH-like putative selenoprotein
LSKYKQKIQSLLLIPSSGGAFELKLDGELVYSKLKTKEFPDEQWAIDAVGKRLTKAK